MNRGKKHKRINFIFKYHPGKEVFLAGSFNKWNPKLDKLTETDRPGIYSISVMLVGGLHEYKFVVDNVWCVDPNNPRSVTNDFGSMNSVLVV